MKSIAVGMTFSVPAVRRNSEQALAMTRLPTPAEQLAGGAGVTYRRENSSNLEDKGQVPSRDRWQRRPRDCGVTLGLVATADAAGPTSGSIVSNAAQPLTGYTPGIPFASGQNINVVIPSNATFSSTDGFNNNSSAIFILECSAPNGVIPTQPSVCDGNTINGNTILPATDGSFSYTNYTLYATPDSVSLGENSSSPACGDTAATECILYIGNDQLDFTKPHLWSAPFYIVPSANDAGTPAGDGSAPTTTKTSTSLSTSLSGGGQNGTSISVPTGTAVSDTAMLSGTNATTATGSVTYNVYTDAGCTTLATGGGGTAETITSVGTLPASASVTLGTAGTYYWGVTYSGDTNNQGSSSTCGSAGEVETVTSTTTTAAPTRLRTLLVGSDTFKGHLFRSQGRILTAFAGGSVSDTAELSGSNAAEATGTVTYTVYMRQDVMTNDHRFWRWAPVVNADPGTVTVTGGQVPNSNAVTLPSGIYEWQASYSGDSNNEPSSSHFGSEVEVVIPVPQCQPGQESDQLRQND